MDAPLHELGNLVMSPHRSGAGIADGATRRRMDPIAAKLNAFARWGHMPDKVDLDAGY